MDGTFGLSNMCLQVGEGFNRDYWSHFEQFCRDLTKKYPSVRIVTGPLYLPHRDPDGKWRVSYEVIGNPPNVAVPTHFYKVIFGEDGTNSPNSKVAIGAFVYLGLEEVVWRNYIQIHSGVLGVLIVLLLLFLPHGLMSLRSRALFWRTKNV